MTAAAAASPSRLEQLAVRHPETDWSSATSNSLPITAAVEQDPVPSASLPRRRSIVARIESGIAKSRPPRATERALGDHQTRDLVEKKWIPAGRVLEGGHQIGTGRNRCDRANEFADLIHAQPAQWQGAALAPDLREQARMRADCLTSSSRNVATTRMRACFSSRARKRSSISESSSAAWRSSRTIINGLRAADRTGS
jgi:hypothetical protein